ncbi:MAG: glycosyltransferase, partial [Planctomycetaceae bacterium]|nr:glycosyltransferase [Planctomycetaceae bacterium]
MKKVVQVVTQMEAGGAQRVAMSLSAELSARGYEDEVWFLYLKRPAFVTEKRVRCLLSHPPRHIWDYLRIVCRLFAMLLRERPDVLIAHTHYSNILALPIGRLLLLRTLIAVQHNPLETYPRAARIVDAWVGAAGAYSVNVTVSSAVRESMRDRSAAYLRRVRTICNGVQTSVPKELVDGVRSAVQVPEQLSLLVNIGRLAEQKNQTLLIRMMSKLPNCFLLIVGDGELREKLRREAAESPAADRIRFLGERPSDEALAAAAAADVFVF